MLRSLLAAFGLGVATSAAAQSPNFVPYRDPALDAIYNLLFCDDLALFRASLHRETTGPWKSIFSTPSDTNELRRIANDQSDWAIQTIWLGSFPGRDVEAYSSWATAQLATSAACLVFAVVAFVKSARAG